MYDIVTYHKKNIQNDRIQLLSDSFILPVAIF